MARRRPLVQQIAEESTKHVRLESTRAAIEKMAEDFAREAMADPEYRDLRCREARAAAKELVAALREANPELHGPHEV